MDKTMKCAIVLYIVSTIVLVVSVYSLLTILERSRVGKKLEYWLNEPNKVTQVN